MKRLVLISSFLFCLPLFMNSQTPDWREKFFNEPAHAKELKEINKLNKQKSFLSYKPTVVISDGIKKIYTYDDSGNEITFIQQVQENNSWVNSYKITYTYDNRGNKISSLNESWDNVWWRNCDTQTFTYDNAGNCIKY